MTAVITPPSWRLPDSAATDEGVYLNRRTLLKSFGLLGMVAAANPAFAQLVPSTTPPPNAVPPLPNFQRNPAHDELERPITDEDVATSYNNFYEFSTSKTAVKHVAKDFQLDPYTLTVDGLVDKPMTFGLEEIEKLGLEERVYRFRCVEAWAMTVPWLGVPLAALLKKAGIKSDAKYVAFKSFHDPEQAPGQTNRQFQWPYYEGLRLDEAMNELTMLTTGMYGKRLPPQNGSPLRVIVPWKYGYKGPKSVVQISLVREKPRTFWNDAIPSEYGFESNVEPQVPHPRWSQATERLIPDGAGRVATLLYNGYAEQVMQLYKKPLS
jgi:sulfoxide reductase catalytic subunit YedY